MNLDRRNYAPEIKRALSDPTRLLDALGLLGKGKQRQKQAAGWVILCPVHAERTPSCSVQVRDGIIVWKCHGCQASGDAITLIAKVKSMSMRGRAFRDVLIEAAKLGGLWQVVDELRGAEAAADASTPAPAATPPRPEPPEPPRAYPPDAGAFWGSLAPVTSIHACAEYLWGRGINPELAEAEDLVRAIPDAGALPPWARYRGKSWRETGHRLVVPMYDVGGVLKSVRSWRICEGDSPKRLPPGGHRSAELVMADSAAIAWLRGEREPKRIVIAEGEPDYCVWATRVHDPDTATIGIVSGSWHPALAERIPIGCRVDVRVDHDEAGDRYFADIATGLRRRTPAVFRSVEAHYEPVSAA